jgi:hypothetical protein
VGLSPFFEIPALTHQNIIIFPTLCSFMRQDLPEAETQAVVSKHLVSVYEASVPRHLLQLNLFCDTSPNLISAHFTSPHLACLNGKFWGIIHKPLTIQHKLINQHKYIHHFKEMSSDTFETLWISVFFHSSCGKSLVGSKKSFGWLDVAVHTLNRGLWMRIYKAK